MNEKTNSPVNNLLRNPYRVLNHIDLINRKLQIAEKWSLNIAQNNSLNDVIKDILCAVKENSIDIKSALSHISKLKKISQYELENDLIECYETGQVEFHITDICDLQCKECHYAAKKAATIPFSKIGTIIKSLNPKAITITGGGEPNTYISEHKNMNDVILKIIEVLPNAKIGLINNNTELPKGEWTKHILWQRSSLDAATKETYLYLKNRDKFLIVKENVISLLKNTLIPYIGIGFLYRDENLHEIFSFLTDWYNWHKMQNDKIQTRFNIQFRPLSPPIESFIEQDNLHEYNDLHEILQKQISQIENLASFDKQFNTFLNFNTNYLTLKNRITNLYLHEPNEFKNCYNSLIHRIYRANGDEYPDFLLCNHQEFALGNLLTSSNDNTYYEMIKVSLMQFYFFNKLCKFCSGKYCRQSWISKLCEKYNNSQIPEETLKSIPNNYFF
jgi:hypothetical protein